MSLGYQHAFNSGAAFTAAAADEVTIPPTMQPDPVVVNVVLPTPTVIAPQTVTPDPVIVNVVIPTPAHVGHPRILILTQTATHASVTNTESVLSGLGYDVTIEDEDNTGTLTLTDYDLIIAMRNSSADFSTVASAIRSSGVPAFLNGVMQGQTDGSTGNASVASNMDIIGTHESDDDAGTDSITILDVSHPITDEFSLGSLTVYSSDDFMAGIDDGQFVGDELAEVETTQISPALPNLIAVEEGTTDLAAGTTPARYVWWGHLYGRLGYTADGESVIAAAVDWLLAEPSTAPTVTPDAVVVDVVLFTPADVGPAGVTVSPDPVAVNVVMPAPTVIVPPVLTPDPVTVDVVLPVPSVEQLVAPDPLVINVVIPTVTVLLWVQFGNIIRTVDPDDWDDSATFHFEAILETASGGNAARARLYNVTSGAAVSGSEVQTTDTDPDRVRSGALTLTDAEYRAELGAESGGADATCYAADVIAVVPSS